MVFFGLNLSKKYFTYAAAVVVFTVLVLNTKISKIHTHSDKTIPSKFEYLNLAKRKLLSVKNHTDISEDEVLVKVKSYSLKKKFSSGAIVCENFSGVVMSADESGSILLKDKVFGFIKGNQSCKEYIVVKKSDINENPYISMTHVQTVSFMQILKEISYMLNVDAKFFKNQNRTYKILLDNRNPVISILAVGLFKDNSNVEIAVLEKDHNKSIALKNKSTNIQTYSVLSQVDGLKFDYIFYTNPEIDVNYLLQVRGFGGKVLNFTNQAIENSKVVNFVQANRNIKAEIDNALKAFGAGKLLLDEEIIFKKSDYKKIFKFFDSNHIRNFNISLVF